MNAVVREGDYHVCIHCYHDPGKYLIHSLLLEEPLPEIGIPLLPDDGEVRLNLQAVFNRTYDAGPYRREIDYQQDPIVPPLASQRMAWVNDRLGAQR